MKPLPSDWEDWDAAQLEAEVAKHNRHYWDNDSVEISDYDYDRLVERLREIAPTAAVLQAMGPSDTGRVGNAVQHQAAMLSLDKAYDEETLMKWAAKFEGELVMTPKIDGVACSIRYDATGALLVAATRGNGVVGEDITGNVRRIPNVPEQIDSGGQPVEVRGEVYMPLHIFKTMADRFANPRNTAAGGLKQKDSNESAKRGLHFFFYDMVGVDQPATELEKFKLAASWGFSPVEHVLVTRESVQTGYESYVARRADLDFEIDGVVFKANRLDEQERLGATSHHPRYAIAYKLQGDSATTTLVDVEWSVSRTGVITPVGIVEPVSLSGATVTRISLHNWGLVQQKKLTIGATVVAMRRGGVIPHLETVVEPGETPVAPPENCPSCGSPVKIEGDFVDCTGGPLVCKAQRVGILAHYAKITDIEGFGQVWLETLVEADTLTSPADYYTLTTADLLGFDRMGQTLADKLVARVAAAKSLPLATFLRALGVPDLGKTVSKTLAHHFGTLQAVLDAPPDTLVELPKFGELLAGKVKSGLADRMELITALLQHVTVIDAEKPPEPITDGLFSGQSFLFTGTLVGMKRSEAQKKVVELGGKSASGVSKSLTYLVVGNAGKAGSKLTKAEKAGVKVLTEDEFIAMLPEA